MSTNGETQKNVRNVARILILVLIKDYNYYYDKMSPKTTSVMRIPYQGSHTYLSFNYLLLCHAIVL